MDISVREEIKESSRPSMEEIRTFWSRTYSKEGKPDWSHIFPYYHKEIIFQDSIQRIEGKEDFEAMCERLTKRCRSLHMEIHHMTEAENVIMMDWKMTMSFRVFPAKPIYGSTKLIFDEEGQIIHQRDYYDLWGDIYDGIPPFKPLYRWFMRKFFG